MDAPPSGCSAVTPDALLSDLAAYTCATTAPGAEALAAARLCLMDALACAFLAAKDPECRRRLGPTVPGATLAGGTRVPGTECELEPVRAAFNIGCLIRWLDYNDTWLAAEWGHPSDNLGAILACADYLDRGGHRSLSMGELLTALIRAYEIQGVLALDNSFNRVGLDHVLLVRVASTAVATWLFGGDRQAVINALSNAWLDGGALRTYRHAPNTGWRKSWAAGDAAARGVRLALSAVGGEMGYPTALSDPRWGFEAVLLGGKELRLGRPLEDYVVRNILFKVDVPVEFHAQTAVACAQSLHPRLRDRWEEIEDIKLFTQAAARRIIDKRGPLTNPADRDHCLQYAVAVALLKGRLTAADFSDEAAADPQIDRLRERMIVIEEPRYSRDYLDPDKRSIANRIEIRLAYGTELVQEQEYPLGHPRRRDEALRPLRRKFRDAAGSVLGPEPAEELETLILDPERLDCMPVKDFMGLLVANGTGT